MDVVSRPRIVRLGGAVARVPRDALLLVVLLAVALIPRVPSLGQPLLEEHAFRQTWTAWTALLFHQRGIDLLHPLVPVFGAPFVLPSEFPLFQALGALVMALGIPTDPAMRVAGLISFGGCAIALWLLVRDVVDRATAFVAVGLFVATPLALLWSRTSMIEYLALGSGLAYLWAALRWRDGRGLRWWPIALALGLVAALIKPPTFVACAIPLALAIGRAEPRSVGGWLRARFDPRVLVLGALPIAAAQAWLIYGDAIKASQPATAFLQTTAPLWRTYYYSTLADRANASYVELISGRLLDLTIGRFMLAFVALGLLAALRAPRASLWLGVALSVIVPIEVFWGGYRRHDYYFIAVSAQTAMLGALGIRWAWRRTPTRLGRGLVGATAVIAVLASLASDRGYWTIMYDAAHDPDGIRPGARLIAASTTPDEPVLVLGVGYDPSWLYYAHRTGLLLAAENLEAVLPTIARERYRTLYAHDPWADALWVTRSWRWVGARDASIYRLADSAAGVADAYLIATDEPLAATATAARVLANTAITIPCDPSGADVPAGRQGTLLVLRAGYSANARLAMGSLSGPVPARASVWLDGALTPPGIDTVRVTCSGASSLVVERVLDAPRAR